MKRIRQNNTFDHRFPTVTITSLLLVLLTGLAGGENSYDLNWRTIDAGGGAGSGGSYTLRGTIGQADSGVMTCDQYQLFGGFWATAPSDVTCDCLGDVAEDGWLSPSDISSLVSTLLPYASSYYWVQAPTGACGDMDADGWLSPGDISALVSTLLPYQSSYYWLQCP